MKVEKIIIHIDMNSYFASVEQQANPFLRGRSLGVCAYLSTHGTIIASSIEAKIKGIKAGTKIYKAKILDPNIILIENEPAKYKSTTEKIFKIFREYTDAVEPYSIDEAFLDLTDFVKDLEEAKCLAMKIKTQIKKKVGEWLECSVGISNTKFLAKFAGDIAPKGDILIITKKNINEILKNRDLKDAWGINKKTETKLQKIGINNLLELKNYNSTKIRQILGRWGYYLWANVNGFEISEIKASSKNPKSIGHSHVLSENKRDKNNMLSILYKLTEKTGRRLRSHDLEANTIHIHILYLNGGGINKSKKVPEKFSTSQEIWREIENILKNYKILLPVKSIAISVSGLSLTSGQKNLFYDNQSIRRLSKALDNINDKYGEYTIIRGRMFNTGESAQDRIGFRKI